jgi:hypothetical protein
VRDWSKYRSAADWALASPIQLTWLRRFSLRWPWGGSRVFAPYIDLLPTLEQLKSHPLWQLKPPDVEEHFPKKGKIWNYIESFEQEIDRIATRSSGSSLAKENVRYALLLIKTRAWDQLGLIPIIDLINHTNQIELINSIEIDDDEHASFFTKRELNAGDELIWCYHLVNPLMLHLVYGIDPLQEPNNYLSYIDHFPVEEMPERKSELLQRNNFSRSKKVYLYVTTRGLPIRVLQHLRILLLSEQELESTSDTLTIGQKVISIQNERMCLRHLLDGLNRLTVAKLEAHTLPKKTTVKMLLDVVDYQNRLIEKNIQIIKDYWNSLLWD